MSIEEQNIFFKKELAALQAYFPEITLLSAVVHRDEVFHPKDDEMKALFLDNNSLLQRENNTLKTSLKEKDEIILTQQKTIQNQSKKFSKLENSLSREKEFTNSLLNISIENEQLREIALNEAKHKIS